MAAIDKIYGNQDQWEQLFFWVAEYCPQYCSNFYMRWGLKANEIGPICNLPMHGEGFLYKHCPHEWVQESIKNRCEIEWLEGFGHQNFYP